MKLGIRSAALLASSAVCLHTGTVAASPILVTFDDITTNTAALIPTSYQGLNWSNWAVVHRDHNTSNGYPNAVVSGDYIGVNNFAGLATISGPVFDFHSAYLTAGYTTGLTVEVRGFLGSNEIHSESVKVDYTGPTFVEFDFLGIDRLEFRSFGGTAVNGLPHAQHFAIDNMLFSTQSVIIPLPSAGLAGLAGLALIAALRRRSQSTENS